MNKTLMWVLVGVVVVAGGFYILKGDKSEPTETVQEETGKKMAFSEFIKQGGSYKCEVKQSMDDFNTGGTVYISGGNIRGDFNTVAEGQTAQTSFILKDGFTYNWSSLAPNMGVKVPVAVDSETTVNSEVYSWSANQIGDYDCEPWVADASMFIVPTNINFTLIEGK